MYDGPLTDDRRTWMPALLAAQTPAREVADIRAAVIVLHGEVVAWQAGLAAGDPARHPVSTVGRCGRTRRCLVCRVTRCATKIADVAPDDELAAADIARLAVDNYPVPTAAIEDAIERLRRIAFVRHSLVAAHRSGDL